LRSTGSAVGRAIHGRLADDRINPSTASSDSQAKSAQNLLQFRKQQSSVKKASVIKH